MLKEYVTTSFMSANEKFNSAMVFETQLDEVGMQGEQQKVGELLKKKIGGPRPQTESVNAIQEEVKEGETAQSDTVPDQTLELDDVNQHECMKNIKRSLDLMQELFEKTWGEQGADSLPPFMQALLSDVTNPEAHLNVKIFVFKLLVNNP